MCGNAAMAGQLFKREGEREKRISSIIATFIARVHSPPGRRTRAIASSLTIPLQFWPTPVLIPVCLLLHCPHCRIGSLFGSQNATDDKRQGSRARKTWFEWRALPRFHFPCRMRSSRLDLAGTQELLRYRYLSSLNLRRVRHFPSSCVSADDCSGSFCRFSIPLCRVAGNAAATRRAWAAHATK